MRQDAIKLELIEWFTKLKDVETLNYLKVVKDTISIDSDWSDDLSKSQKEGIERGLNDIKVGRTVSHDEVKAKYGL